MKKAILREYLKNRETGITTSNFANKIISKRANQMVEEMMKGIEESAKARKKAKKGEK